MKAEVDKLKHETRGETSWDSSTNYYPTSCLVVVLTNPALLHAIHKLPGMRIVFYTSNKIGKAIRTSPELYKTAGVDFYKLQFKNALTLREKHHDKWSTIFSIYSCQNTFLKALLRNFLLRSLVKLHFFVCRILYDFLQGRILRTQIEKNFGIALDC